MHALRYQLPKILLLRINLGQCIKMCWDIQLTTKSAKVTVFQVTLKKLHCSSVLSVVFQTN